MLEQDFAVDSATNLPNMFGLIETETKKIASFEGTAVLFDLVGLCRVNEELGISIGDHCILAAARSLEDSLPDSHSRCYRLGGDEFIALLPDIDRAAAEVFCQEVIAQFSERCSESGLRYSITVLPEQAQSLSTLLRCAFDCFTSDSVTSDSVDPDQAAPKPEQLLERLLNLTGDSIMLIREAQESALTDPMTELPNNRAVEAAFCRYVQQYEATGDPFSVLLIDGDHLKRYNEELGYAEGNRMITRLGRLINAQMREGDLAGRWMFGDEFLVLLKNTPRAKGALMAERIRRVICSHSNTWPIPVSVSIGVAGCPENGTDYAALIKTAEEANKTAKREGKNRVK
ncbi:MAG TPA: hypothetical protein DHD79_05815 [Firmicutes bacterium]|nr:hypothetical protein [Bacillota bacterium]HCX70742.1 hypothetical protein [Bacillota bacterium]